MKPHINSVIHGLKLAVKNDIFDDAVKKDLFDRALKFFRKLDDVYELGKDDVIAYTDTRNDGKEYMVGFRFDDGFDYLFVYFSSSKSRIRWYCDYLILDEKNKDLWIHRKAYEEREVIRATINFLR